MREDSCDGIWKALEAVHADNEDVIHSTVLEFRDHLESELGTFGLGDPKTEKFLLSTQIDPQGRYTALTRTPLSRTLTWM